MGGDGGLVGFCVGCVIKWLLVSLFWGAFSPPHQIVISVGLCLRSGSLDDFLPGDEGWA